MTRRRQPFPEGDEYIRQLEAMEPGAWIINVAGVVLSEFWAAEELVGELDKEIGCLDDALKTTVDSSLTNMIALIAKIRQHVDNGRDLLEALPIKRPSGAVN